ncbi:hypothetical protein Ancab_038749 [Ancistrocladus abbreviatus]
MELPQSRALGAEGRKATQDFLSLYSHSPGQQDRRPPQGGYLKTHNFLQPLQREERKRSIEENVVEINIEKASPSVLPPPSVEHLSPGGTGTYSISHIPNVNPRVQKQLEENAFAVASASSNERNDDDSLCSSYTGSGFTLWDGCATIKKGKVGKENFTDINVAKEPMGKLTQWPLDRASESSSNHRNSFSSLTFAQLDRIPEHKSQSFMEMIKSAKAPHAKEEDYEEDFSVRNGSSSQKGELQVKVDGKSIDQKADTPRSKHSATEQRRRCKINDRFQMLRELIPHSDQKKDKASFLLEVIEYIQVLQEKVHRHEVSFPGWNHGPAKLTSWSHGQAESSIDQTRGLNGVSGGVLTFGTKLTDKNDVISSKILGNATNPVEPHIKNAIAFMAVDQQAVTRNKAASVPMPLQADVFAPVGHNGTVTEPITRLASDTDNKSLPQFQLWQSRACASDSTSPREKLKEQDMAVDGGTISISSIYSQGLLNTLTQALQSSGVDLSQASISVQVDIGKRAINRQDTHKLLNKVYGPGYSESCALGYPSPHLHRRPYIDLGPNTLCFWCPRTMNFSPAIGQCPMLQE